MEEDSSESEDGTDGLMTLLQSKKKKHKTKDQDQAGGVGKKKGSEKGKETDMRRMFRNLKRKREPDEDEEDSEDNKYVDITEEQQALKVIQLKGIRCSNPNRVAQFINEKFKFHNLADMWPALCAVVDGRSERPLLLAVDAASYEAYMGRRTMRQAALKGDRGGVSSQMGPPRGRSTGRPSPPPPRGGTSAPTARARRKGARR